MKHNRNEANNRETRAIAQVDVKTSNMVVLSLLSCASAKESTSLASRTACDNGHRYGNFHNYYRFNPASNRTSYMSGILDYVVAQWNRINRSSELPSIFRYLDVGCNEGDLTLEVSKLLADRILTKSFAGNDCTKNAQTKTFEQLFTTIHASGMDLDSELIRKAQAKFQQQTDLHPRIQADFRVCDVLKDGIVQGDDDEISPLFSGFYRSDLTTIFSTTMWLHIHGGDEGLQRVLRQICLCTRHWILLEPQPSKCYATAAFRLRRRGLEPVDVSNERLQLRSHIEEAIESILRENHFERIAVNNKCRDEDHNEIEEDLSYVKANEAKTPWNRSLRLYGRVAF